MRLRVSRVAAAVSVLAALALSAGACTRAEPDPRATPDEPTQKPPKKRDPPPARTPEKHRATGTPCPKETTPATRVTHGPRMRTPDGPPCTANADCKEQKNGRCSATGHCSYDGCYADADCGKGGVCVCTEEGKRGYSCVMGNCSVDGDCDVGSSKGYCSPTYGLACGAFTGTIGWYCHTKDDDCVDDADCKGKPGKSGNGYCAWSPEASKWVCGYGHCVG